MAKICPKCGREYEGDSCPYCEKPKVLVNREAYEKRRAAYERRQGTRRSSVTGKRRKSRPAASKTLRSLNAALAFLYDKAQDILYYLGKLARRFRKVIIAAVAVFLLLLICISAGSGMWRYMHTHLWVYADGTTSQVDGGKLSDVSEGRTTFWSDYGKAYFSDIPSDLAGAVVKSLAVSKNGKYFAAVVYTGGRNVVCRWKSGNPEGYERIASEEQDVEFAGLGDSGALFFLVNPSSQTNWAYSGSGATAFFARSGGSSVRVDVDVSQFHGTPESGSAVYIRDGVLYQFSSDSRGTIHTQEIAQGASDLQVPETGKDGVYTQAGGAVLESGAAYIYRKEGTYYLADGSRTEKLWECGQSLTFFMRGRTPAYAVDGSGVFMQENGVLVRAAGGAADSTYVWLAGSGKLLFTDEHGEVCVLSGRKIKVLPESLRGAKLSAVSGLNGAAAETSSGISLVSVAGKVTELAGAGNAEQVVVFRGKTYAAGKDGQLLVFDGRGEVASPGAAVKIWIQQ